MKIDQILICTFCKSSNLDDKENYLECIDCKSFFPKYKNRPVMFTDENDFYHLRKALLPAKYRINKYGN
tara:strand:- start:394 stop:600 length:207 start_codon:yes stop_codon:yes gene_type:complete